MHSKINIKPLVLTILQDLFVTDASSVDNRELGITPSRSGFWIVVGRQSPTGYHGCLLTSVCKSVLSGFMALNLTFCFVYFSSREIKCVIRCKNL